MRGLKTYYIKATELRDRFQKAVQRVFRQVKIDKYVCRISTPSC